VTFKARPAAVKKPFVLSADQWIHNVLAYDGDVVMLTDEEAKYALLAYRLSPYGGSASGGSSPAPSNGSGSGASPAPSVVPHVNFLMDVGQDVDDAAAMSVLIELHKQGKIVLQSVTATPTTGHAPSVARAMLDYAGLQAIPVAARKGSDIGQADYMNAGMASFYGYGAVNADYPDPVPVLRTALAAAPDGSAIICVTGPMPDLYDLLQSQADSIDTRSGKDLVKAKCQRVTFQDGGNYDATAATVVQSYDFNWSYDPTCVNPVFQALQAMSMTVWCAEGRWGQNDAFSGPLLSSAAASNPLKKAFDLYQQNNGASIQDSTTRRTRASWDVAAALSVIGLADRYTLAAGFMSFDQPNNNTSTWTRDPTGNFNYLVPAKAVPDIIADMEVFYDAYDQGPTTPAAPIVTITEAVQGSVVVSIVPQFFVAWTYSIDNGATWTAVPANGTLTTLSPATAYTFKVQGTRYGLTSPTTISSYTTKAAVRPTSIAAVPGVVRFFDFTHKSKIAPTSVSDTVRLTSVADEIGSGNSAAPDGTQGPVFVASSVFGSGRPAIRSVNGDVNSGAVGTYARVFGDLPELAGKGDYAVFGTVTINNDRNDNGRIFSLANTGSQDWSSAGFAFQVPSSDRASVSLYGNHLSGGTAPLTHDTPMLFAIIVTGGSAQLWINGVPIGSPIALGSLGSATPRFGLFREVDTDSGCIFGDAAGLVVLDVSPTTLSRQYVEGKLAWAATGDGSLLPANHPNKSAAP
jgi:hypothetical protein